MLAHPFALHDCRRVMGAGIRVLAAPRSGTVAITAGLALGFPAP
jgi:hypothetical protein